MNITTKISVEGLTLHGFHGVGEQERKVGNTFVYDVEVEYPWMSAGETDNLSDTLSYAEIVDVVRAVNGIPADLLENVAYRICRELTSRYGAILSLRIRVSKPHPPVAGVQMRQACVMLDWKK